MLKRVVSLVLVSIIAVGLSSTAFALEKIIEGPTGGMVVPGERSITAQEQIDAVKRDPSLSETQKQHIIDKINGVYLHSIGPQSYDNIYLGMKQFKQINTYYCGPATVYQTLHYSNGSSPSQQNIASALGTTTDGTDGTKIPPYLNSQQTENSYIILPITQLVNFKDAVKYGMKYKAPTVLRIRLRGNNEFGYTTDGHFLNIGGQNTGATQYLIVDPYFGYANGPSTPTYYVSDVAAFNALTAHPYYHLYY